jgi:L-lactate dehydrogenase (cytochrome)
MTVIVDGGIRRGTDVIKARGLGADFCFAGRPYLYAAAIGGIAGVRHAADILEDEIMRNLALLGAKDAAGLGDRLRLPPEMN